jgi:cytochrome c oxidase assembly protein subunit 11
MIACIAFVGSMVGMAYAAVPLYQLFCQATGYGGTPRRVAAAAPATVLDRQVTVRFDANTASGLPWDFAPVQHEVVVRLGETVQVAYRATNRSDKPVRAQAAFNVTPAAAGAFFNKVDCFCFTESRLEPGETADLPIVFFIDPAYVTAKELKNIQSLTLSYTFYPLDEAATGAVAASPKDVNRNI